MSTAYQLPISNVVNISVSQANPGVGSYNTSNLGLFTTEIPANSFGSLGYAQYITPTQVGVDFGTSSRTYAMANAIFSQQPNILTGGGQLVVILLGVDSQLLTPSAAPASGAFVFTYGGNNSASIASGSTAAQTQAIIRAMPGLSEVIVTGTLATAITVQFAGVYGAIALATITSNTLNAGITITVTHSVVGETIGAAITRTANLVQYFGIIVDQSLASIGSVDLLAAAAIVQPLNKIALWVSHTEADIQPGGMIDLLRTGLFTQSRGLYYGVSAANADILMMSAYAGRAFSTNFSGSNTTSTMHLKVLSTIQPDTTMTQTILNEAITAGADTYISLQGVSSVYCVGANSFFDEVYNLQWIVGALQVAGFNFLAQANTKVPQTEAGMDGLKGAYRAVCEQGVSNQYLAPGSWNSATVFGNPADLLLNVAQRGYYIYSSPIATQSQSDRSARKAPLIQIAIKEAGAIQKSTVIVNVNA